MLLYLPQQSIRFGIVAYTLEGASQLAHHWVHRMQYNLDVCRDSTPVASPV